MEHRKRFCTLIVILIFASSIPKVVAGVAYNLAANSKQPRTTPTAEANGNLLTISEALEERYSACIFPCFFGFDPDRTTREELISYLEETGVGDIWKQQPDTSSLEEYMRDGYRFGFRFLSDNMEEQGGFSIAFGANDLLRTMQINFSRPNVWLTSDLHWVDLPTVLSQIEDAPEIYIGRNSSAVDFTIYIIYRDRRMQFTYDFDLSPDNLRQPLQEFCLDITRTKGISMLIGVGEAALINVAEAEALDPSPAFYSFEELFDVSTEELVQFFIDNPNGCFDTSEYSDQ